jgi:hypothetical protein
MGEKIKGGKFGVQGVVEVGGGRRRTLDKLALKSYPRWTKMYTKWKL